MVLVRLHNEDDYTLEEIQTACEIAGSLGARGPELIPHVIGRATAHHPETEVGERLGEEETKAHGQWLQHAARFDALSEVRRRELIQEAKASNPIIARRPEDHPLVRAAAIALMNEEP